LQEGLILITSMRDDFYVNHKVHSESPGPQRLRAWKLQALKVPRRTVTYGVYADSLDNEEFN